MLSKLLEYPNDVIRLFYPRLCGGCEMALNKGEQHLCVHCRLDLPFTTFENMRGNPVEKIFYGRVPLEFATSFLSFSKSSKVQNMMHAIKYQERKELALFLGRLFGQRLQNNPYLQSVTTLMPVPLHPQKQQLRGFNQSELFAEGINETLQLEISKDNLIRPLQTSSQTKKTRIERWENVEHAFEIKHPKILQNKHILLIDDVLTTGATLEACAQSILDKVDCKISVATIAFAMH
ncbi:MAG TPA: phosphoribosyltransferase family protein [Chitinophagales bacterium]|jgi:ComF family protein|nr:ComF family protein [Chitinophagales bacterium]HQV78864.1 phosphoribosyltransferase family protein [Chitinophagales bacterium]HQW79230.1 phosphoribosyltransferase family protein [Chitinophagales bacterium]HRB18823.1 phosphoribosyltransferase family protein [Chitinophagales bacterium]HRB66205.1 phosphoribosyltransferase family protein [Chitinophagales bacterium]